MARAIDVDKLLDDITAAEEHGGMGAVIAGTLKRYVMRQQLGKAEVICASHTGYPFPHRLKRRSEDG